MKQCPKCGRYMTWYMVQTNGYWKCVCGYDTRSVTYTLSDRTERKDNEWGSENKCHRHGIRLEDGTPIYECIGCDKQDCERIEK